MSARKAGALAAAEDSKTARFVEIGGNLGKEFVVAQPDRHGDAERGFDPLGERGEKLGGTGAMKRLGAAKVEERFIDRQRLDRWRKPPHLRAHFASNLAIFRHVGPYDDCIGAGGKRLEHGHGRTHAIKPRHVAAGEHNAVGAAADDHGAVG